MAALKKLKVLKVYMARGRVVKRRVNQRFKPYLKNLHLARVSSTVRHAKRGCKSGQSPPTPPKEVQVETVDMPIDTEPPIGTEPPIDTGGTELYTTEPIINAESLPEVQRRDPVDGGHIVSQGLIDSLFCDLDGEETPEPDGGPLQTHAFSTIDNEVFDRAQIADQPRIPINLHLSGRKLDISYSSLAVDKWWFAWRQENLDKPNISSHIGRIMETELGVQLFGEKKCTRCQNEGLECWVYSEQGVSRVKFAGTNCARCRALPVSYGCSHATRRRNGKTTNIMMGHVSSCSSTSGVMSTQHQSDTVIEDDAGSQKIEPVREVRVQALTHTEHPSPAAGPSFSHHFRSLFVSLEFYPNSVTIEYQNWHNSDVQCKALAVPPPPACELSEERPVMAEPVKDGRLILHAIIPKDYPGGKEGFSSTSAKFLRNEQTFGIAHIYFGEDDIAAYLKMVSESFKEQSKSSSRSKNKEPKGKAIKWKNPATAFGCRYVWAHDLATPHLLYFRIRPTWVDLTALAVVDTTHDGYRNELGNSKERFVQLALPQIHLSVILKNYKLLFQQSSQEQPEVPGVEFDPTQAWWWNIVQENQRRRHLAQLAAAPEPVTESTTAEDVTGVTGSAGDSPESPTVQPVQSEEPDDDPAGREVSQTAPCDEDVAGSADALLTPETIEASEEHKDEQGKEQEVTTDDSNLTYVEDDNIQPSQLTKETPTEEKGLDTGSFESEPIEKVETHDSSSTLRSETTEPLEEPEDKFVPNGADITKKATAKGSLTQVTAKTEATSTASTSSVGEKSDIGMSQMVSKSKKKKSKKKKTAKESDKAISERASVGEIEMATAERSSLDTVPDDDPSWNVVTHAKKRQVLTKSKSHESSCQNINQTLSKMGEAKISAPYSGAIPPPPQINDSEFPRLPAVPENSSVHHTTSLNLAKTSNSASRSAHSNNNVQISSSYRTVTVPVIPTTTVQPLAPPFWPRARGRVQPGPGAFIQLDSTGFPCSMENCDKRCCSLDYTSVICPRCGPLSEVRYCGKEHLFADVKNHWQWCGQFTFMVPARGNFPVVQSPPLVPSFYMWDNPERFRLALHHAVDRTADFFVFSDWIDYKRHGQPADILNIRCPTRVTHRVSFSDPVMKDRFRRILGVCLMLSPVQLEFVNYIFRMIRDNLREQGVWNNNLSEAVLYQMTLEFGVDLQDWFTGTRHACEVEWVGGNRCRGCRDRTCLMEHKNRYGSESTLLEQKTKDLEANFWILRAHRYTHPDIPGMSQEAIQRRTRGEGFPDVFLEDQRLFVRGPGWDHAAGEFEIEDYGG